MAYSFIIDFPYGFIITMTRAGQKKYLHTLFFVMLVFFIITSAHADDHFAETETLVTSSFKITLTDYCSEGGSIVCNDIGYHGVSKKTGKAIGLKGKTEQHCVKGDSDEPHCKRTSYVFKNGDVTYQIFTNGKLKVYQGSKILLEQQGVWKTTNKTFIVKHFPFTYSPDGKTSVMVYQDPTSQYIYAKLPNGSEQKLWESEVGADAYTSDPWVTIEDYNFDGQKDIGFYDNAETGGVHYQSRFSKETSFSHYVWLWDKKTKPFKRLTICYGYNKNCDETETLENFLVDADNKLLVLSDEDLLDGGSHLRRYFAFHKNAQFKAYLSKDIRRIDNQDVPNWKIFDAPTFLVTFYGKKKSQAKSLITQLDPQKVTPKTPPLIHTIQRKTTLQDRGKDYLYEDTNMYLIKNDKVQFLDFDWELGHVYLIRYKGKRVIEKWIDAKAFIAP